MSHLLCKCNKQFRISVFPLLNYYSSRFVTSTYTKFPHYKKPTKSLKNAWGNTSSPCKLYYIRAQIDKIDCYKCFLYIYSVFQSKVTYKSNHCLLLVFQYTRSNDVLTLINILHCVASTFD